MRIVYRRRIHHHGYRQVDAILLWHLCAAAPHAKSTPLDSFTS
jgi:hypothetical protein